MDISTCSGRGAGAGTLTVADRDNGWVAAACCACEETETTRVLAIAHADAPNGWSYIVQCRGCGLRRLSPRPSPGGLAKYYGAEYNAFIGRRRSGRKQRLWDTLRDTYATAHGPARLVGLLARWVFDVNVRVTPVPPRVIELGCGYGDLLAYLRSRGCEVQGVDLDARAAAVASTLGVPVHVGTIEDLRAPSSAFDVGVLCHSLEHVPDPGRTLAELSRVLKPGGLLHVAVPNGAAAAFAIEGSEWPHVSHPLHFWFFHRRSLLALLERHGFAAVSAYTTSRWHHATAWLHRARGGDIASSTRRFLSIVARSAARADGGDVLRITARRVG
jgi:SAM-dependent methyltransferase